MSEEMEKELWYTTKEINIKDNLKMTKGMAKVFTTLLMEINTKDNLKMTIIMAKVFTTLLMAASKRNFIRMGNKWAANGYDLWKNNY